MFEPMISRVSQSRIRSQLAVVPSRPIDAGHPGQPVVQDGLAQQGLGRAGAEPVRHLFDQSLCPSAPAPTSRATFPPAFSTSAARCRSAAAGAATAVLATALVW